MKSVAESYGSSNRETGHEPTPPNIFERKMEVKTLIALAFCAVAAAESPFSLLILAIALLALFLGVTIYEETKSSVRPRSCGA